MKRVYCSPDDVKSDKIYLPPDKAHYIKDVLRLQKGDKIEIFDGGGMRYNCAITQLGKKDITVKIESSEFSLSKESAYRITLAQALPNKAGKMDFIVEKATELGVDEIIPIAAQRSVIKPENNTRKIRWQKIACEASRQCNRAIVPKIKEALSVKEAVSVLKNNEIKLFPCINKDTIKLHDALNVGAGSKPALAIAVFIGPEGDFTKEEIIVAKENDFRLVSLGERVLRTETAGLYVLSVIDYVLQ